jgi:hypothetical protein
MLNTKVEKVGQVWTLEKIKELIEKNDKMVARSIVQIYQLQTEHEKSLKSTNEHNGIGFNSVDSFILTSFAEFYIDRGYLSPRQLEIGRKKIKKYAKQLLKIIEGGF